MIVGVSRNAEGELVVTIYSNYGKPVKYYKNPKRVRLEYACEAGFEDSFPWEDVFYEAREVYKRGDTIIIRL